MDKEKPPQSIRDRIWLTSKSRIYAEKRLKSYDTASHLLLSASSVFVVGITIFSSDVPDNIPVESYSIFSSIIVLVMTIIVFGFRFGKEAILHRECYLRLDKLRDATLSVEEMTLKYHEILGSYPNHGDIDYERLILTRTLFADLGIRNSDDQSISWNYWMLAKFIASVTAIWIFPLGIIAGIFGSILLWG